MPWLIFLTARAGLVFNEPTDYLSLGLRTKHINVLCSAISDTELLQVETGFPIPQRLSRRLKKLDTCHVLSVLSGHVTSNVKVKLQFDLSIIMEG
jgi:hypothetical protein